MYLEFFELREQPFQLSPDPHFLYPSQSHARAKAYMDYTVWRRDGFVVLTGEIGAGKTTLIQTLLSEIDSKVKVVRVFQTQLNEIEFLQAILVDMGFDLQECSTTNKVVLLSMLNDYLIKSYTEGKHVVLIVDEAQNLSPKVLEEIRMLAGVELEKEKILNIILVGQPELNETLKRPDLQQLVQRIRLRFHVGALNEEETAHYIQHRLVVAGATDGALFEPDTIPLIYKYSGGVPRRINILCDTALICAFADSEKPVTRKIVMEAVKELQWAPFEKVPMHHKWASEAQPTPVSTRHADAGAPEFHATSEHWASMFNLLLNSLSDMSARLKSMDEKLLRLSEEKDGIRTDSASLLECAPDSASLPDRNDPSDHKNSDRAVTQALKK